MWQRWACTCKCTCRAFYSSRRCMGSATPPGAKTWRMADPRRDAWPALLMQLHDTHGGVQAALGSSMHPYGQ